MICSSVNGSDSVKTQYRVLYSVERFELLHTNVANDDDDDGNGFDNTEATMRRQTFSDPFCSVADDGDDDDGRQPSVSIPRNTTCHIVS